MFSKSFKVDHKNTRNGHNAIYFETKLSNEEIIKKLNEMGIADFVKPDKEASGYNNPTYNDKRIEGVYYTAIFAGCCSFSKRPQSWYLYPISEHALKNTGLDEQDLIEWIHFLNATEAGFEYLYFGEQALPTAYASRLNEVGGSEYNKCAKSKQYWVAVPPHLEDNRNLQYLHWIALRYLINTTCSTSSYECGNHRLPYYMIPRATMMFNKEYGIPKLRAFLYAHLTASYYSYYGLAYTDQYNTEVYKPCVHITRTQFKELIKNATVNGTMNELLTSNNYNNNSANKKIVGLKNLDAPYNLVTLHNLFAKGDYEGFLDHIKESYKTVESNIARGKMKITSKRKLNAGKKVVA